MAEQVRVGWIGVGLMGHGAARNILEKGCAVSVLAHRNREPVDDLLRRGATEAASPAALAAGCDIVFSCLPSTREVEAAVLGPDGVLAGAHPGLVYIDSTTAEPHSTLKLAAALAERGAAMLDAPFTRTPNEAEQGRLNTLVGGDEAVLARVRPVLERFCENIFHVGALGDGHRMKLVHNALVMGTGAVVAEVLATAARLGLDLAKFNEFAFLGGADSRMLRWMMPYVLAGDPTGQRGTIWIGEKDARAYLAMAVAADAPSPVLAAAHQAFVLAKARGDGGNFIPTLPQSLAEAAAGTVRPKE